MAPILAPTIRALARLRRPLVAPSTQVRTAALAVAALTEHAAAQRQGAVPFDGRHVAAILGGSPATWNRHLSDAARRGLVTRIPVGRRAGYVPIGPGEGPRGLPAGVSAVIAGSNSQRLVDGLAPRHRDAYDPEETDR